MIGCLQVEYSSTTAYIDHNNGNFAGANFTLTSGGSAYSAACGVLAGYANSGSQGKGDTATIAYTAPARSPTPNFVTITATSMREPEFLGDRYVYD